MFFGMIPLYLLIPVSSLILVTAQTLQASTPTMFTPTTTVAVEARLVATQTVIVGENSTNTFNPPRISAGLGEVVEFVFVSKNHTFTQSSFAAPCQMLGSQGFDSGFIPVAAGASNFPTFSITVDIIEPIWAYCRQTGHCGTGMVFVINSDETSSQNFAAFQALAIELNGTASGSATLASTSPTSSGLTKSRTSTSLTATTSTGISTSSSPTSANTTGKTSGIGTRTIAIIIVAALGGCAILVGSILCIRRQGSRRMSTQFIKSTKRGALPDLSSESILPSETIRRSISAENSWGHVRGFPRESGRRPESSFVANAILPSQRLEPATSTMQAGSSEIQEHPVYEARPTIPDMDSSHSQTSKQSLLKNDQLQRIGDVDVQPYSRQASSGSNIGQEAAEATSGPTVTLMMQEINELRAQMAEVVRRQQIEASRESRLSRSAPSEGDDSRTAPPAYSDGGF